MTPEAKRLQDALRKAKTDKEMETALDAAAAYVTAHPKDVAALEPLMATMHVIEMTLAA